jgi:hypothetical protein
MKSCLIGFLRHISTKIAIVLTYLQARALFAFESGGPGELTFNANEVLTILRQVCG